MNKEHSDILIEVLRCGAYKMQFIDFTLKVSYPCHSFLQDPTYYIYITSWREFCRCRRLGGVLTLPRHRAVPRSTPSLMIGIPARNTRQDRSQAITTSPRGTTDTVFPGVGASYPVALKDIRKLLGWLRGLAAAT